MMMYQHAWGFTLACHLACMALYLDQTPGNWCARGVVVSYILIWLSQQEPRLDSQTLTGRPLTPALAPEGGTGFPVLCKDASMTSHYNASF